MFCVVICCYTITYHIILYYIVLCYLCFIVFYCVILYYIILCYIILYYYIILGYIIYFELGYVYIYIYYFTLNSVMLYDNMLLCHMISVCLNRLILSQVSESDDTLSSKKPWWPIWKVPWECESAMGSTIMGIFRDRNWKSQQQSVQTDTGLVFFNVTWVELRWVEQSEKDEKIPGVHRRHDWT